MNLTLNYTGQIYVQNCCSCGITFGVPTDFDAKRREDHQSFYCPSGHPQSYRGKTEEQKQRDRAERLERQLANRDEDLRSTRASLIATKGQLTKTKNRIAKGICPCCNRSFVDLGRHMAGQHPDYTEASNA